jgi:hypothetical protein
MPFLERQGNCNMPIDQLRIGNWTEALGNNSRYVYGVISREFHG